MTQIVDPNLYLSWQDWLQIVGVHLFGLLVFYAFLRAYAYWSDS